MSAAAAVARPGLQTPAFQIREQLERLRCAGLPFHLAWRRALERVRWPDEKEVRDEWKTILNEGIDTWREAYELTLEPVKGMAGLAELLAQDAQERQPMTILA